MSNSTNTIIVLGGGLAGLSAGYALSKAGCITSVFERDSAVGGLSRTIERNGFRFDLGGHRFFTTDETIDAFVRDLMGSELVSVQRSSRIYMRGNYFDYPLRPINAMFGLGLTTTARILADYARETLNRTIDRPDPVSLEDWVVRNFGRTMFNIYFKEYSEKVWGVDCSRISASWVAQRIKGLSLATAIKNAFFKFSGRNLATLTDSFLYPALGIGRISDRLRSEIEKNNAVFTNAGIMAVNHRNYRIESVTIQEQDRLRTVAGDAFISSIPVTSLVRMLNPAPPAKILETAARLRFRDLVVVAIMVDREQVTDQTWIYIPEQKIPFGRIHEPTNWSRAMAPAGKSLVVAEYFSFKGDPVWSMSDEGLAELTVDHLARLGFLARREHLDSMVVRVPKAYPLFKVGYRQYADALYDFLGQFENLHSTGRSGMFRYYNMDVAIKSGLETAAMVARTSPRTGIVDMNEPVLAGT